MKWFGSPWPSAELRAPVCEDDADRVPVPVGKDCIFCDDPIIASDQGLTIPHMTAERLGIEAQAHLNCFLRNVGVIP